MYTHRLSDINILFASFDLYITNNMIDNAIENCIWIATASGFLSRKNEMVVKYVFTKLYTLPKARF